MRLIEELRLKRPVMANNAKTSRKAAIRLFCLECVGGSAKDVKLCCDEICPLYPFRLGVAETKNDAHNAEEQEL